MADAPAEINVNVIVHGNNDKLALTLASDAKT